MRLKPVLTIEDARRLMEGARDEALQRKLEVSLAIVDEAGVPILLERLDNARLHTPDVAMRKARTAAIARASTASLQSQVAGNPALLTFPDRLPLGGGLPVLHDGQVVGAVACSGATTEEDEAVCRAALARLGG